MTNNTDFSVRKMMPVVRVDPVAGYDQVDALAGPHVELADVSPSIAWTSRRSRLRLHS
jgi:hypothetical protein